MGKIQKSRDNADVLVGPGNWRTPDLQRHLEVLAKCRSGRLTTDVGLSTRIQLATTTMSPNKLRSNLSRPRAHSLTSIDRFRAAATACSVLAADTSYRATATAKGFLRP
jgi:hypothetical protein